MGFTCVGGGSTSADVCVPCHESCGACAGPTRADCTVCALAFPFLSLPGSCLASCTPAGKWANTSSQMCEPCFAACGTCSVCKWGFDPGPVIAHHRLHRTAPRRIRTIHNPSPTASRRALASLARQRGSDSNHSWSTICRTSLQQGPRSSPLQHRGQRRSTVSAARRWRRPFCTRRPASQAAPATGLRPSNQTVLASVRDVIPLALHAPARRVPPAFAAQQAARPSSTTVRALIIVRRGDLPVAT